jgi:hypothetical protein
LKININYHFVNKNFSAQAKIPCSENCKCVGCRNVEESTLHKKSLKDLAEAVEVRTAQLSLNKTKIQQMSDATFRPPAASNTGARYLIENLIDFKNLIEVMYILF